VKATSINDANLFSISRLAELFGHTRETVSKKLKEGGATPSGKKSGYPVYKIKDVAVLNGGASEQESPDFENIDPDKLHPKDRDSWYASELKKTKLEKDKAQLLDKNEVAYKLSHTLKKVALTFDTLADVLERDVGLSPEQITKVNFIADNIRQELADSLISDTDATS
jgi:hypothetical protein